MKKYPDIYIPSDLEKIINAKPQTPSPPRQPSKPVAPTKPTWLSPIIIGLIALVISFFIFQDIPVLALIVGTGTTFLSRFIANKGYRNDLKVFRESEQKYPLLMSQYQREKSNFERIIEELNRPEVIRNYKLQLLNNTTVYQPDGYNGKATKGRYDSILLQYLKQDLPGEFYSRATLNIPDYKFPYSPDVAYRIEGIYIDLEVDEPYHQKEDGRCVASGQETAVSV